MFDRVHSVDSVKLAQRLARFATKPLPILMEVNVSGEESKYGFDGARRDELFNAVEAVSFAQELVREINLLFPPTALKGKAIPQKVFIQKFSNLFVRTRDFAKKHEFEYL